MNVNEFKSQYPQYKDIPDQQLSDSLYEKFYKGKIDKDKFTEQFLGEQRPKDTIAAGASRLFKYGTSQEVKPETPIEEAVMKTGAALGRGIEGSSRLLSGIGKTLFTQPEADRLLDQFTNDPTLSKLPEAAAIRNKLNITKATNQWVEGGFDNFKKSADKVAESLRAGDPSLQPKNLAESLAYGFVEFLPQAPIYDVVGGPVSMMADEALGYVAQKFGPDIAKQTAISLSPILKKAGKYIGEKAAAGIASGAGAVPTEIVAGTSPEEALKTGGEFAAYSTAFGLAHGLLTRDWRGHIDEIKKRYETEKEEGKATPSVPTEPTYKPSEAALRVREREMAAERAATSIGERSKADLEQKYGKEYDSWLKEKFNQGVSAEELPLNISDWYRDIKKPEEAKALKEEKPQAKEIEAAKPAAPALEPAAAEQAKGQGTQDILGKLAEDIRATYGEQQKEFVGATPAQMAPIEGGVDSKTLMDYTYPLLGAVDPKNPVEGLSKEKITKGELNFAGITHEYNVMPVDRDLTIPERAAVLRLFDTIGPGLDRMLSLEKANEVRGWIDSTIGRPAAKQLKPIPEGLRPAVSAEGETHVGGKQEGHDQVEAEKELPSDAERGFIGPDEKFQTRAEAKNWVERNQPEVAAQLPNDVKSGERELHSEDLQNAESLAKEEQTGVDRTALDALNDALKEAGEAPIGRKVSPVEEAYKEEKANVPSAGRTFIEPPTFQEGRVEKPITEIKAEMDGISGQMKELRNLLSDENFEGSPDDVYDKMDRLEERYRVLNKSLEKQTPSSDVTTFANPFVSPEVLKQTLRTFKNELFDPINNILSKPPEQNEVKYIFGDYGSRVQQYKYKLNQLVKAFNTEFKSDRQRSMSRYLESGGSENQLREWAEGHSDKPELRKVYEDALTLTTREKEAADQVRQAFDEGFNEAVRAGILDNESFIENYFSHLGIEDQNAIREIKTLSRGGAFRTNPSFAKRRMFATLFELEKAGYGQKKGADEIGYGLSAWLQSLAEAKAAREAIKATFKAKIDGDPATFVGVSGRPMNADEAAGIPERLLIRPNVPKDWLEKGYRRGNFPQLRRFSYIGKDTAGRPVLFDGDVYIHPKAFKYVNAVLGKSWFRESKIPEGLPLAGKKAIGAAMRTQAFLKGGALIGAFHPVHVAVHGLAHGINVFNLPEIDMNNKILQKGMSRGLMLFNDDVLGKYGDALHTAGLPQWILGQVKKVGDNKLPENSPLRKLTSQADFLDRFGDWTFKDFIPRLKAANFLASVKRGRSWYAEDLRKGRIMEGMQQEIKTHKDTTAKEISKVDEDQKLEKPTMSADAAKARKEELQNSLKEKIAVLNTDIEKLRKAGALTEDQFYENIANQQNASYGEMNSAYMGRSKTFNDGLKAIFLAPDFLEARLRYVGQAFGKYGKEQRRALLVGAIGMAAVAQTLNVLFGDKHEANWKKPFTVTIGGQDYTMRSALVDAMHLGTNWRNFFMWRISPMALAEEEIRLGRDRSGRHLDPDQIFQDLAKSWMPLPIQGTLKGNIDSTSAKILTGIIESFGIRGYRALTDAEQYFQDLKSGDPRVGGSSKEDRDRYKKYAEIRRRYKRGDIDLDQVIDEVGKKGLSLSEAEKKDILMSKEEPGSPMFEQYQKEKLIAHRRPHELMKGWRKMDKDEQAQWRDLMLQRIAGANIPMEEKEKYYDELTAGTEPPSGNGPGFD